MPCIEAFCFYMILKIGHRGAKGHVAENTLESFERAFELGADGIELDVHLSADGEAIVIHDHTVDRTIANAAGFVRDFTVEELTRLGVPTLVEVIHLLPKGKFLNVEIKDARATSMVVEELEKFSRLHEIDLENCLVSSFDWDILKHVNVLNPALNLGVLTEDNMEAALAFALEIKAYSINPYFKLLSPPYIRLTQKHRLKIHTWTVNSLEDITFVKNLGVDAIISDFPDRI